MVVLQQVFWQKWYIRGKGLKPGAEPPLKKLCWVITRESSFIITVYLKMVGRLRHGGRGLGGPTGIKI